VSLLTREPRWGVYAESERTCVAWT